MRIGILTYLAHRGAFATVARNIATGLAELGVSVDILHIVDSDESDTSAYPAGTRFTPLGGRARACALSVARYLRSENPDALISLGWLLNPWAVLAVGLARTRTPLLLNEGSLLSYKAGVEHRHELRFRYAAGVARLLYPRASAVTGASAAIVDDLVHRVRLDPRRTVLRVIENAVDVPQVERLSTASVGVVTGPGPVFVNVARHARQKNLPLLLRAFSVYADTAPGTLVMIGEGPESDSLIQLAAELGVAARVRFAGYIANPFPQVAASTAFVLSSEEEGFGLVLVEAMALGVPVISTDCPGGPRDILRGGRAGLLVPPGDVEALASAMAIMAQDEELRTRLAAAGRERVKSFSPVEVGRQWLALVGEAAQTSENS